MNSMSHVIQGTNRWLATPWVPITDVTGTGTPIVQSNLIAVDLSALPAFVDWVIEVSFDLQRTGGTGNAQAWLQLSGVQGDVTVADATGSGAFYTGILIAADTKRARTIRLKPAVMQGDGVSNPSRVSGRLRVNGSAADTEFAATAIQVRVCYLPL